MEKEQRWEEIGAFVAAMSGLSGEVNELEEVLLSPRADLAMRNADKIASLQARVSELEGRLATSEQEKEGLKAALQQVAQHATSRMANVDTLNHVFTKAGPIQKMKTMLMKKTAKVATSKVFGQFLTAARLNNTYLRVSTAAETISAIARTSSRLPGTKQ